MSTPIFSDARQRLLAPVDGKVLEIGFGTGLNLPYYPNNIDELTTVDVSESMNKKARQRIAESSIRVDNRVLNGESLPMDDQSFDCIVSTWTLCSIEQIDLALQEIHRLLMPDGRFFFIEHGLSPDPRVQIWQRRLNPIQKLIGCGCRLDRNIRQLLQKQGFYLENSDEYYLEDAPKTHGYMYEGIARIV